MGLDSPLGEDAVEQHVTEPSTDPLIARELCEQRLIILAHLGTDRPGTKPSSLVRGRHPKEGRSALERSDPLNH